MEAGVEPGLTPRARRALPLIAAAMAVIVVVSLLYVRASAPPPAVVFSPPPETSTLSAQYHADYDFVTSTLSWAFVSQVESDISPFWIFRTTDAAKHWMVQLKGGVQTTTVSLRFFDQNSGIVSFPYGIPYFYRTLDGGAHWVQISLPAGVVASTFADPKRFWVLVGTGAGPPADQLMASSDGGRSWVPESWPKGAAWGGKGGSGPLAFRPSGEGWLGSQGDQPSLYVTRDRGMTWASVTTPTPAVAAPSPVPGGKQLPPPPYLFATEVELLPGSGAVAFVIDYYGDSTVYESFDAGQSWRRLGPPPNPTTFGDISYLDSKHWWAMRFGSLFKTSDAGASWKETRVAPLQEGWDYHALNVIDSRHAWVTMTSTARTGGGALSMTADGGASWNTVTVPQPG
jgi:hypothetical protein